jgi:hypothetical protein
MEKNDRKDGMKEWKDLNRQQGMGKKGTDRKEWKKRTERMKRRNERI